MVVAKRLLAMVLLVVAVLVAAPAMADDGLMPPPTDATTQALVDQYPPESLTFYAESTSWFHPGKEMKNGVTVVVTAFFEMEAAVVKWTVRLLDYAWNFNLSRWLGGAIDNVSARNSTLVWSFGGLLCLLIAAWMVYQVWQGALSRMVGFLGVLGVVLALVIITQSGVSAIVADVEDVGTDLSGQILTAGALGKGAQGNSGMTSMTDGIYRQLILEQWANANFTSLAAAAKYQANGIPGGRYLGLTEDEAQTKYKEDTQDDSGHADFQPWYADGSLGKRIMVVFNTLLALLLFLPVLLLLSCLVLGTKAITVFLAMAFPFALFWAAVPWSSGLRGIRTFATWACIAPIAKVFCSIGLAIYIAFLNGLIGASGMVPGGWATVTLIMGSMAVTLYLVLRPMLRSGFGLFRRGYQKTKDHDAAIAKARERVVAARARAEAKAQGAGGGAKPHQIPVSRKKWMTQTGRRLHVLRPGQQPPTPVQRPQSSQGGGGRRPTRPTPGQGQGNHKPGRPDRRRHVQDLGTYVALRNGAEHRGLGHKRLLPEYDLADLLREAKRMVRAMGHAAENMGGRRR